MNSPVVLMENILEASVWACCAHCHWDVTGLRILRDRVGTVAQKRVEGLLVRQIWDRVSAQNYDSNVLERTVEIGSMRHRVTGLKGTGKLCPRMLTRRHAEEGGHTTNWKPSKLAVQATLISGWKFQEKQDIHILSKHL